MAKIVVAQGVDTIRTITRECARLSRREKGIVLGIGRQFEAMGANDRTEPVARSADRP